MNGGWGVGVGQRDRGIQLPSAQEENENEPEMQGGENTAISGNRRDLDNDNVGLIRCDAGEAGTPDVESEFELSQEKGIEPGDFFGGDSGPSMWNFRFRRGRANF